MSIRLHNVSLLFIIVILEALNGPEVFYLHLYVIIVVVYKSVFFKKCAHTL
jgi:hypothetical protein